MVGRLLVSQRHANCRRIGFHLFGKLAVPSIPKAILDEDEKNVRLVFYELQRNLLDGETMGRLLISLIPCVASMDAVFQAELSHELILRGRDSGACRKVLETRATEFSQIQNALEGLDRYFQALKDVQESGLASMEVPGLRRAARLQLRGFAKRISDGVTAQSVLLQLVKQVAMPYGDSSGLYVDGQLRDANPYSEFSHQMEFPVLEFSDPEGGMLRRMGISAAIAHLTDHVSSSD
jgi:hypothetical protein